MRDYIEERAIHIAQYIVDNGATVRQTARQFGVSKSTVHKDVTQRLIQINPRLAFQTRIILDINKSERHIRGGMAKIPPPHTGRHFFFEYSRSMR